MPVFNFSLLMKVTKLFFFSTKYHVFIHVLAQSCMPRDSVPKITNYMQVAGEMTLLQNIDNFKVHYRVTRQTFEIILEEDAADLLHCNVGGATPVPPDRQFLVCLNYVANQHTMRNCGHFNGMSISTVHGIISSVTDALLNLQRRVSMTCMGHQIITSIYMYMEKCVHF